MKKTLKTIAVIVSVLLVSAVWTLTAHAGTNQATDPGGGGVSLGPSNTVTVNSQTLNIVKEARLLDGTLLASPVNLPSGAKFYFVLYIDNTADIALSDVRIIDAIDTGAFTMDATTFEILNSVASPGLDMTAANLTAWTTAGSGAGTWNGLTWNSLTVGQDADQLDWSVSVANRITIGQPGNAALNVAVSGEANKVTNPHRAAFRFQVTLN